MKYIFIYFNFKDAMGHDLCFSNGHIEGLPLEGKERPKLSSFSIYRHIFYTGYGLLEIMNGPLLLLASYVVGFKIIIIIPFFEIVVGLSVS